MWRRVREFAVPQPMIDAATARRAVGDWAGACAAARVTVDLDLRAVAARHGRELATALRADLRHLAPDLLRWHLPRIAPDGLLRPGLTLTLARYGRADGAPALHLVARTPPAWADAGQRIGLALWDPARPSVTADRHPHPHPSRRFRLDLHRHLWDARRSPELPVRCGAADLTGPSDHGSWAVDRWAAEAGLLLRAEGRPSGRVGVRLDGRHTLVLDIDECGAVVPSEADGSPELLLLPDAATFLPPDVEMLRAGLVEPDALHPLVAVALVPGHVPGEGPAPEETARPSARVLLVDCRGEQHRIGLVDGTLAPLDHDPGQLRREQLLAALSGTPLPCLRAVDRAYRSPQQLDEVRGRLDHGDLAGARTVIEALLGPDAELPAGPLRDELRSLALRRIDHGLYRAGLSPVTKPHPAAGVGRSAHRRSSRPGAGSAR
ncbi:hypothetical protein SAMN05414137_11542 [Streptacidiphilus jiangxiensis]|uniref:Uncharacterized protein n=2 Tax=Streptacidiphilus jiangxiensis TaxID=235985 RepID=A0A1H7U344_STRJI|nr:hypothetical protein SAMN05414137_11542 [Streptacidiphilus jiangxiensis]